MLRGGLGLLIAWLASVLWSRLLFFNFKLKLAQFAGIDRHLVVQCYEARVRLAALGAGHRRTPRRRLIGGRLAFFEEVLRHDP